MRTVASMLAGAALFSPIPATAQEAAPDPVESFLAAWNRGDVGRIGSLCAADAEYTEVATGTVYHGSAGCEEYARLTFAGAPDFELEATTIVRDGNRAVAEWIMSGTQTGDWPGLPATGARFSVPGVSVIETDGALIRRVADYFDLCTLLRQLGALPDLGGTGGMAVDAGPVAGAAQAPADAAGLPEYVEAYRNAWNRHNATAVAAFFGEDADLVMGNLPAARGRGAIEAWWRRYFERQEPERRLTLVLESAHFVAADVAVVDVATTTGGRDRLGLELPTRRFRGTWVLRRQDGPWLISAMRGLPTEEDRVELVPSLETAEALRPRIRAFVAAYEETFNRHDPDALSGFYRDDADIIVREGPVIHGARAIREWWRAYFSRQRPYRALLIIEEIRMMADDVALLNVVATGATLAATDEPAPVRRARGTWVLVRENGEWRIAALRVLPSEDDRVIRASAR